MERQKIKFLKVFFIALLGFASCEKSNTVNANARVIIIGAGSSGIAAASKLMENGFSNVTILEAENRIGGRVYTTKLGNYSIDLGGQWVHGEVGNVAFKMAKPLDLLDVSDREDYGLKQIFLDSSGNCLSLAASKKLQEFFHIYVYDVDPNKNPGYEDLGHYAEKAFDEVFKDDHTIVNDKKKYLDQLESMRFSLDPAESWHDISVPEITMYKIYPGDQMTNWKKRGYSTILDLLMKRYPNPKNELPVLNHTILNSEVISIDYSNRSEEPLVLVKTSNGQVYKADHVIVTVSLGVLKDKHKHLFTPKLPDYKVNAIEGIGFGAVAKIFMLFEKPFWNLDDEDRSMWFSFMWNDDSRKQIKADPEKKWLLGMGGAMTVEHKPQLLSLWVTGKYVKQMENLPEEVVFNHSVDNLQRFLGKTYNVSKPIAMMRSRWYSNPHFKGSYSYRSVESHKRQVYPEMLERPLNSHDLRVLFAGEATESDRFSTVDGAIKSGWKAADRLIEHYKKSSSGDPAPGA